jgi:hypothetical protein
MIMHLLTIEQKDLLVGQPFAPASIFNPIQDINGDWFISPQEVDQCENPDFLWVKDLPLSTFVMPLEPENRHIKVDQILTYMKNKLTDLEYINFISDVRNYLTDYVYLSDSLIYWVETTNNQNWGDYTQNGFKTKTQYRGELVDGEYERAEYILNILNSSI